MNSKNLKLLSVAALVIILLAIWMGYARSPRTVDQQSLYPDLKGKLAAVTGLSVHQAGDQLALELNRDGAVWKVKQRFDYPADAGKVNALLIGLADATLREQKTANAVNYAALAVQDMSDPAATGVRIELAGVTPAVNLIIGKRDGGTRSTYVRRMGETQSWLVGAELDVAADISQWLKRDIVNIGADRIQEVSVQLSGSPNYSAVKTARADANFDIIGIPKGREVNSVAAANSAAQSLSSLQLDDVRPAAELSAEKSAGRATSRTFDGLVIETTGYRIGEQRWITLKATFDAALAQRFHLPTQATPSAADKKEAAADSALEALNKKGEEEAAAINASTASWAYALPAFKYDAIFKPLEDLLKKSEMMKKK